MSEDRYTRITLRIPKEIYALLQDAASETSKSVNAEIVNRLASSFSEPAEVSAPREQLLLTHIRNQEKLLAFYGNLVDRLLARFRSAVQMLRGKDYSQDTVKWLEEEVKDFDDLYEQVRAGSDKPQTPGAGSW